MQSVLRLSDLSTEDDDPTCCKINKYEKKIDNLMNMVGTLKKEVRRQWKDLLGLCNCSFDKMKLEAGLGAMEGYPGSW